MTIFRLKEKAVRGLHEAPANVRWNYDRLELLVDGVIHAIGVGGGLIAAIVLYLAMGWSGVMVYDVIADALPKFTLCLIAIGGVLYSAGVVFHVWERLRFQNAIWHGFVLLAASCHYAAVLDLIIV